MIRVAVGALRAATLLHRAHSNAIYACTFVSKRRRDERFPLVPFTSAPIALGAALALTVLVLLILFVDPLVPSWTSTLSRSFSTPFKITTDLAQSQWVLLASGLVLLLALFADEVCPRRLPTRADRSAAAVYVFVAVSVPGITAVLVKYAVGRARPKLFEAEGVLAFRPIVGGPEWASFPSGHATTAAALAVALALLLPRYRFIFFVLGLWLAGTRLFTRSHYPSDIYAGCLLGAALAWLVARAFARHRLVFRFAPEGRLVRAHTTLNRRE